MRARHVESVESVVCVHEWKSAVVRCSCGAATQTKQRARAVSGGREREIRSSGGFFESCSDTRSPGVPLLLSESGVPHSAARSPSPPTCSKKSKQKQSERAVTLLLCNSSAKATLAWLELFFVETEAQTFWSLPSASDCGRQSCLWQLDTNTLWKWSPTKPHCCSTVYQLLFSAFSKWLVWTNCCITSYFFVTSNSRWKRREKVQPWNDIITAFYVCKDDNEWLFHHHFIIWLIELIYFMVTIKLWGEICSNSLFILAKMIAFPFFFCSQGLFFFLGIKHQSAFQCFSFHLTWFGA